MEKKFFVDGGFVTFYFVNEVLKPENRDKTVKEILEEKNLVGLEHYILNPSFLLETLSSEMFLVEQNLKHEEVVGIEIENLLKKYFEVKKDDKNKGLYRPVRNALAHYHIDFKQDGINPIIYTFYDKDPEKEENHFIAEINNVQLAVLLQELSKIL